MFFRSKKFPERPVIIFGTGGSGTRLVQSIVARGGYHMGYNLNHAGDALDLVGVLDRNIDPVLRETGRLDYSLKDLSEALRSSVMDSLQVVFVKFFAEKPSEKYVGFKNPRWIFLLPFLMEFFPHARFCHIIRNGVDIAGSSNQNQFSFYGDILVPEEIAGFQRKLLFWARVNQQALNAGASSSDGGNFEIFRIEDIWAETPEVLASLVDHVDLPITQVEYLMFGNSAAKVRKAGDGTQDNYSGEVAALMRAFNYLP